MDRKSRAKKIKEKTAVGPCSVLEIPHSKLISKTVRSCNLFLNASLCANGGRSICGLGLLPEQIEGGQVDCSLSTQPSWRDRADSSL